MSQKVMQFLFSSSKQGTLHILSKVWTFFVTVAKKEFQLLFIGTFLHNSEIQDSFSVCHLSLNFQETIYLVFI